MGNIHLAAIMVREINPEKLGEMGVGPQEHLDIIDKTFKNCVK